jgi:hypothetical protein
MLVFNFEALLIIVVCTYTLSHEALGHFDTAGEHQLCTCKGIFVMECTGTPFRKFFLRRAQGGTTFLEPLSLGIIITNTPPSSD